MAVLVVCGRARLAVVLLLVVASPGKRLTLTCIQVSRVTFGQTQTGKNSKSSLDTLNVKLLKRLRGDKKPPGNHQSLEANSKTSAGRVGRPPGAAADSTEMLFDVHGVSHRE